MDQDMQSSELAELYSSLPKGVDSSHHSEDTSFVNGELRIVKTDRDMLDDTDAGNALIGSILRDNKAELVSQTKRFLRNSPNRLNNSGEDQNTEILDRSVVAKLLRLCCMFDSVECASALIGGEVDGIVPRLNEVDESGRSQLHTAAEVHATRCIELLLRKRARTDLKSKDKQSQLALELSLSSRRMDVVWTVDDPIEDLLICLNQKDLTAVRLLSEKTKEIAEVAYKSAMDGKAVSLAALLMVAAKKFTTSIVADFSSKGKVKTTIYDCVIREALSLSSAAAAGEETCASTNSSESSEKRKLLLCEMELLQLYGAVVAQSGCKDKKVTSALIRASMAGDAAVLQILLKTEMDMNEADAEGNSALHWSLKMSPSSVSKQIKTVCLLIKHGARVGQRNRLGLTPLHIAAGNGNLQALQILLLEDPNGVHATTETKETPLFFAVRNDFMDCAELLLQWGANSEVLNLRKQRPIDFAKSQDMRFILNPANISFMNRPCSAQRKYTADLNNGVISETCESLLDMGDDDSTTERICLGMKTLICKYFEYPGGCVRGDKCFYAHGEQELRPTKHGTKWFHFRTAELRRKIFVGGLPPSVGSESLREHFEQFGLVEDANVVNVHGNQQQSRGFGFVTFKHENSVAVCLQAHYVSIMGKQVEIKSAVPRSLLLSEHQDSPPHPQKEEQQNSQLEPQTHSTNGRNTDDCRPEPMSWADRLLSGEQKTCKPRTNVIPTSVNQREPAWLHTFKKWIPKFLKEVSERLGEGEWYALSSLKSDFRATCGVELDHASLGYSKLSDFVKSLPGICRIKIVPVGGRGPATHMVLLPNLAKPKKELVRPINMTDTTACAKSIDESGVSDSAESKFLEDVAPINSNLEGGYPFYEVPQKNLDTPVTLNPRFLQFLKPDPVFHVRPWLKNVIGGSTDANWELEGQRKLCNQQRHLVLEALARKQNNTSVFFLRDINFFENYKASIARGKCFACSQRKILWANFPCQHLLWCDECKVHAARAAGTLEHKCVICDARVLDLVPRNVEQVCYEVSRNKEYPPL